MAKQTSKRALNPKQTRLLAALVVISIVGFFGLLAAQTWYQTTPAAKQKNAAEHLKVHQTVARYITLVESGDFQQAYGLRTDGYRLANNQEVFTERAKSLQGDYRKIIRMTPDKTCAYSLYTPRRHGGDKEGRPQIFDQRFILYEAQVQLQDGSRARVKAELKHDKQLRYQIEGIQLFGGPALASSLVDGSLNSVEKVGQLECRPDLELRWIF